MEEIIRRQAEEAERHAARQREEGLARGKRLVLQKERDPSAYISAARSLKQLGELRAALELLRMGLEICNPDPSLHEYYIERLEKCNRTEEAIAAARQASLLFPDQLIFRLREALLLPVFYNSSSEIDRYRQRFAEGLSRLVEEIPLDTQLDQRRALEAISKNTNKYLAYQGRNDRTLQTMYGSWASRIMTTSFPQWSQNRPMPKKNPDGRLRIGYVSSRFREGSVTKAFMGWLSAHDQERFAVFAYHAGAAIDRVTEQVQRVAVKFRQLPNSIPDAAQTIRDDKLYCLIYLDLGMAPMMTQLACFRLAPVQCMAWDFPVTSGLPTIDYCFTGELMEPEDACEHYAEKLLPLPGIGINYAKPVIPRMLLVKTRADFGLHEDAVVYLSPQTVFKYLPAQDCLFAKIAARVPKSQFVFLVTNELVMADFKQRLRHTFAQEGLSADDHCVLMPEVNQLDYWNLHSVSDVVLDSIGWSGGVSTFDAVACGIPIVTLPGDLMRGRQSYAILSQLGVTETIASNEGEYVDIAVKLGTDRKSRQSVSERMIAGYSSLYSDRRSVRALEDFYDRIR